MATLLQKFIFGIIGTSLMLTVLVDAFGLMVGVWISQFAQNKVSGPRVLNKKSLSIPVDLLRTRRENSEILTNQRHQNMFRGYFPLDLLRSNL